MSLKSLKSLRITTESTKSLVFNVSYQWIPPFRLNYIQIQNCRVGPFPMWLQVQSELTSVTLKNTGISGTIPDQWFSKLSGQITRLDLSKNQIEGKLQPHQLAFPILQAIDLSSNRFEGPLPLWSTNVAELFLEDNSFSGPIPQNLTQLMPGLQRLHLSRNHLSRGIPSSLCQLENLQVLSLRSNHLSGEFPNCWNNSFTLWGFDVANNDLSGAIPISLGFLPSLTVLMLGNNKFHGEIPSSLQNRSGQIPPELCSLGNLPPLDLSENSFLGVIPKCFDNLAALVYGNSSEVFENQLYIVLRGREPEYSSIVGDVNGINLSGNDLKGEIPDEITSIHGLHMLNLSRNQFSGRIPDKIGNLEKLEALDLSHNRLSGSIPQSLSSMIALKHLNLSYNKLQGQIPRLPQFNDASVF
ncbi:receptor-like protein EIX2 [Morus notabilis]|nr:receptor-like protein EIX2 [Morus notabilis]